MNVGVARRNYPDLETLERRESFRQYLQTKMCLTRWTRRELSRRSGVSEDALSKYFAGEQTPNARSAKRIREAFELVGL